jgi:hypothetical protein
LRRHRLGAAAVRSRILLLTTDAFSCIHSSSSCLRLPGKRNEEGGAISMWSVMEGLLMLPPTDPAPAARICKQAARSSHHPQPVHASLQQVLTLAAPGNSEPAFSAGDCSQQPAGSKALCTSAAQVPDPYAPCLCQRLQCTQSTRLRTAGLTPGSPTG